MPKPSRTLDDARAEYENGRYPKQSARLNKDLPKSPRTRIRTARLDQLIGMSKIKLKILPHQAIEHYNRGLAHQSIHPLIKAILHNSLADAYLLLKQYGKALNAAQRALDAQPDNPDIESASYDHMAFAAVELGQHQRAIEFSQKAVDKNPSDPSAGYLRIAFCLNKLQNLARPLRQQKKACAQGQEASVKDALEKICSELKQSSSTSSTSSEPAPSPAAKLSEGDALAKHALAQAKIVHSQGKFPYAIWTARQGLNKYPTDKNIAAALLSQIVESRDCQGYFDRNCRHCW